MHAGLPSWLTRVLKLALIVSVAGSLAADAILARIGTAIFPATSGYVHFRFPDYAKLTVAGVVIGCLAWPIVTRLSSAPRWIFSRLAVLVTLVLWLPDLYILDLGQPGSAVAVHIAKVKPAGHRAGQARTLAADPASSPRSTRVR